ncbi:MAG: hypothetical protein MJ016_05905 [Victivallaceae bacterium]|nr:hypothetical protein [Victivallaceae bacterium]
MEIAEPEIYILEPDGSRELFRVGELQNRLFGAFVAVGRSDSAALAEDIALALERALTDCDRPGLIFGRGELDAAVVRLLENAGYPEAARFFSRRNVSSIVTIDTSAGTEISAFLQNHLACSPDRFHHIVDAVIAAAAGAGIREATPQLLLELARHYERECREVPLDFRLPEIPRFDRDALLPMLREETARLVSSGILRVGGVDTLFPSIRFYALLGEFAADMQWVPPVTELTVFPCLRTLGQRIEEIRGVIGRALNTPRELPCLLTLPDLPEFLGRFFQQERSGMKTLAAEVADAVASEIRCRLYKLSY